MEQELLDKNYNEGKSDREIELPDSEFDDQIATVEEIVKIDESYDHEKDRINRLQRDARNKQWENVAKKGAERKKQLGKKR